MRIAMVTSDYLPNIGGISSHIAEISQAMANQGHTVRIWFWDSKNREPVFAGNVPTELLELKPAVFRPRGMWYSIKLIKVLRKKIAKFEPEILHVHTLAPVSLSMRWLGASPKYRRILTNHSSSYLRMIESWLGRQEAKFYCSGLDGLLAPSQELLEKSRLLGLDDKRCQYIPNGVDAEKFVPGDKHEARSRLNLPHEKIILLATRRFAVKNGLRYLAVALDMVRKQIPNVLCVFCGNAADNEELPTVRKVVSQYALEDYTRFEGSVPNDRIKSYLDACDVTVLPSLIEATSISGLEAMAASKPIVGTRVGGIPDLIQDGLTGLLAEPANSQDLARCIVRLLKDYDLEKMGQAARARVLDRFTWKRVAERTVQFYKHIENLPAS